MTDERMALIELIEKQSYEDLVREMLTFAAERIMEAEVEERSGAAKDVRSPLREVQRTATAPVTGTTPAPDGSRWRSRS